MDDSTLSGPQAGRKSRFQQKQEPSAQPTIDQHKSIFLLTLRDMDPWRSSWEQINKLEASNLLEFTINTVN